MSSISSLLKSAASTRDKVRAHEDSVASFMWESSAQTQDDWNQYSDYLQDRLEQATEPSESLTYQRKMRSAQRSFISNEIQRASINIMYGQGDNMQKYNLMTELFYQAQETGDLNLAQNLMQQLGSLSIQIQNEQERKAVASQRTARTLATNQMKDITELEKKFTKGDGVIELPDGRIVKSIKMLEGELKAGGDTEQGFFTELLTTVEALTEVMGNAYQGLNSQDAVDKFEDKYSGFFDGSRYFTVGGRKMTISEIVLAKQSADANNPLYSPASIYNEATGQQEFKLEKNKVDDFVWAVVDQDAEGNPIYQAVKTRAQVLPDLQSLETQITDNGEIIGEDGSIRLGTAQAERDSGMSIKNRLESHGYRIEGGDNGQLNISIPGRGQYEAVIMPDGSVRFIGEPGQYSGQGAGIYQIDPITGMEREVAPDETSDFGTQSVFGGRLSQATASGQRFIDQLSGVTTTPQELLSRTAQITSMGNDFTGLPTPVMNRNLQGGTSGVLGVATETRANIEAQRQLELQAERTRQQQLQAQNMERQRALQSNVGTNLNQMPVRQYAQNGQPVRQLTVARPTSTPRVTVAAPSAPQRISNVGVAQPTRRISGVGVSTSNRRVRVY
jgi:hypothetical protein